MKIRVESGSALRVPVTGVGQYTTSLVESLRSINNISLETFTLPTDSSSSTITTIKGLRRRLYTKLNQFRVAPAFDTNLEQVDLTIFPDFALWPTKKSKINTVVIHDLTYLKFPEYMRMRTIGPLKIPVTAWYLSSVVRRSIKKADFIITVSNSAKQEIANTFGVPSDKIVVTEIPPSEHFLAQKNTALGKASLMKKYSIHTSKYILSVGTIEPRKNQIETLRAYINLPKDIKETYSLVFAGTPGWSSDAFLTEFNKAKLAGENVILTGYFDQEDTYALHKHASLYTSASYYEGFGMPVLAAAVTQTPTVLSDIPVFREITNNGSVYVDPSDSKAYSKAIFLALTNSALRKKNITAGSVNAARYSWDENSKRIITIANKILSQK